MAENEQLAEKNEPTPNKSNTQSTSDGSKSTGKSSLLKKAAFAIVTLLPAGFLQRMILIAAVVVCAGGGFGVSRIIGKAGKQINPEQMAGEVAGQSAPTQTQPANANNSETDLAKAWYYDLEPVVANLNEPGATRYVRAALTLEMSGELEQKKTTAFLKENTPPLKNWLTIYLAGQTIDQLRGDRNLKRIQSEILDSFNEKLFPNARPQIKQVLINQFAIQ